MKLTYLSPRGSFLRSIGIASLLILHTLNCMANPTAKATITGKVLDEHQEPIPYATIFHRESKSGTLSNELGMFELNAPISNGVATFEVSSLGYDPSKFEINLQKEHNPNRIVHLRPCHYQVEQVIVSGQAKPTPVDSSIYKLKLISQTQIRQSGALNLGELLNTEANLRLSNDLVLGTQIEMQGLSGQNVKIMLDGVPIVGRLNGNVDLSQINLDNIKQVEVIEGPMSVIYGNNALAGTINLISKDKAYHSLETNIRSYTESQGRYQAHALAKYKTGKHQISLDGNYSFFEGVDFDKTDRSMDWKPKQTYDVQTGYRFELDQGDVYLRASYFQDKLIMNGNIVDRYKAFDTDFFTTRFDLSGGFNKSWGEHHLKLIASQNSYTRDEQQRQKDLRDLSEKKLERNTTQKLLQQMSRVIYSNQLLEHKLNLQLGSELNIEQMEGQRILGNSQDLKDLAAFANINYQLTPSLELQPGLRYGYNSGYSTPLVYSLNTKWQPNELLSWRFSMARGFRAPSIKELYYVFVDSNHQIYGNPDLKAETSQNFNASIDLQKELGEHQLKFSSSQYFNHIKQMISLVQRGETSGSSYRNFDSFKTTGGDLNLQHAYKHFFKISLGYNLVGRQNLYAELQNGQTFNWTHNYLANFQLFEPTSKLRWRCDYKLSGRRPYFYQNSENSPILEGYQESFHTVNTSFIRQFMANRLEVVLGVKNLLDVTTSTRVGGGGGAHSSSNGVPISYGRSVFLSMAYKFYQF